MDDEDEDYDEEEAEENDDADEVAGFSASDLEPRLYIRVTKPHKP